MSRISLLLSVALAVAAEPVAIERLGWLSGCWQSPGAECGSGEQWSVPAGGTMLGMSRYVRDGKTVSHEFVRISETEDGSLVFLAPGQLLGRIEGERNGQSQSVDFPLVRSSCGE